MKRRILVTGGAGCIGSALCRQLVTVSGHRVTNVDKLTYAGSLSSLASLGDQPGYRFERLDIADNLAIGKILMEEQIDSVIHAAAETHVDRSIASPAEFIGTNVVGTFQLLQTVLEYWRGLNAHRRNRFRFHFVSTDEVFGDAGQNDVIAPVSYVPSSPYSASKAAAEHLVRAWHRTYGLPVTISNASNNFGPFQFPDKLIPLVLLNALKERPLPIYGDGENLRSWVYVEDHARALELVLDRGRIGETYHFSGLGIRTNISVVRAICRLLDEKRPRRGGRSHEELIAFVPDRAGHDHSYSMGPRGTVEDLDWSPVETFETALTKTIDWYLENEDWWKPLHG